MVQVQKDRRLSTLNRIVLWLHYFLILSLLISIVSKYISPLLFWLPAFFGLSFPFLFLGNILLVIYWLVQFKPAIVFGLVALALSLPTAFHFFQISLPHQKQQQKSLKVTSYNSMLFDLYNWSKNSESRAQILSNLDDINPDIFCVQEFYTSEEKGDFNNTDTIKKLLGTNYHHAEFTTTLRDFDHWGIATFSKFPIINQGKIVFNTRSNNICIFSDIVCGKDTLRVYNIHLQSVSFSKSDNQFLDDVISQKDASDEIANSKNILRRLKRAFIKRTRQVEMIVAHMSTCKYKMLVCGDFNETAASYSYRQLSKNLNDAFVERGFGLGKTYVGKWPQFRIDYILHDPKLNCAEYYRSLETFTDHYPITAVFDNINW
jgi:endonuclease/exonuclease/phosphatase family metal-dependent hydrolase